LRWGGWRLSRGCILFSGLDAHSQTFANVHAWNANPLYGREIGEQVKNIKEPVENFLAAVLKYEPSLGAGAKDGHHQHIFRKLQWTTSLSKKVLGLRRRIESQMRIIDTLMQRLTRYVALQIFILTADTDRNSDAVMATQKQLPLNIKAAFQQTIRPELITMLQDNLVPLSSTFIEDIRTTRNTSHGVLTTRLAEHYGNLFAGIQELQIQLKDSKATQMRIETCLQDNASTRAGRPVPMVESNLPQRKRSQTRI
jgi:hypothetical protein